MTARQILTQYVQDQLGPQDELVIIAPDAGRVKLTRKFAQDIGVPYALLEKERPAQQVAEIGYVIGADKVQGKRAVIVDDMIDTGGTLAAGAQTVLDAGASEVYAVATHGLFSGNAFETLADSPLSGIVVTDTVPLPAGAPDLIRVLTCAEVLTDTVRKIFTDESVSEIFAGENQLF
jgi:ribose-phosphate pyrophosphokinase